MRAQGSTQVWSDSQTASRMKRHLPLDKTDHSHSNHKQAHSDGGCVSADRQSMLLPENSQQPVRPDPECVSMKSDQSMRLPQNFSREPTHPDPDRLNVDEADDQSMCRTAEPVSYSGHSISKLTDDEVLKRVKQKHKASLKRRFENISEGARRTGAETLLSNIYTELYITEGQSEGVNKEHEVWHLESAFRLETSDDIQINCNDIFKPLPGHEKHIRTVMTKGVAGIGKTVSVQKFIIDWTEEVANQNIDFIFPLPFRELNLIKNDQYSLHRLLLDFHPELEELKEGEEYKDCQILFIFDGLDESQFLMDYKHNTVSDVQQPSSVDVLMTSLIQGSLLPSALIWITSRPAAASQVPAQSIDQLTEVRGFSDPQKEEYFRKRISDVSLASRIISHIKVCRSLHIMCHIPVFCWITATVLQQMLIGKLIKDSPETETLVKDIPKTMTELFVHFLLIQTTRKDQKYQGTSGVHKEGPLLSQGRTILKLAELAFRNLKNGNLMFYEEDLRECGIDVTEASVYSGMCTEIFKEESVFRHRKVYCFVHLSIQEFLAAVHVFHFYVIKGIRPPDSLFGEHDTNPNPRSRLLITDDIISMDHLYKLLMMGVEGALNSKNGHLDLFLRFLIGISLERNHRLLKDLWDITHSPQDITHSLQYLTDSLRDITHSLQDITDSQRDITHSPWGITHSPQDITHSLQYLTDSQRDITHSPWGITRRLPDNTDRLWYITQDLRDITDKLEGITHNSNLQDIINDRLSFITHKLQKLTYGLQHVTDKPNLQEHIHSRQHIIHRLQDITHNQSRQGLKTSVSISKICKYIKGLNRGDLSPERCINLFHCLFEVNDYSMHEEIQKYLESPKQNQYGLSPAHCSALAHMLLMSEEVLDEFDLKKYNTSDVGRRRLLPAMRCFRTARLPDCGLSDESCGIVAGVLQSPNHLIELDLSHNDLSDSGVQLLSAGLSSPQCRMQTLRLAGCGITKASCEIVAAILQSPNSLTELDLSLNGLSDSGVQLFSTGLCSPHCKLQTLKLAGCGVTKKSCEIMVSILQSPNSLIELDLSHNELRGSGVETLSAGLSDPRCRLQRLRLSACAIPEEGCVYLASALASDCSHLKELDLSYSHPGESGLQLLFALFEDPGCELEILKLAGCRVTDMSCKIVASVLQSLNSLLELDLSTNDLGDSGVQTLMPVLCGPYSKLQTLRLACCGLTENSCEIMASMIQSENSLVELDLSHNDFGDSGVQHLAAGLSNHHCKLLILRLSRCLISKKGCSFLASALALNHSTLKELDLSYNHPGELGLTQLSARLKDPKCKLETLNTDHCAEIRLRPDVRRYGCDLTLDPLTANRSLLLSNRNKKVTHMSYPQTCSDRLRRFDHLPQELFTFAPTANRSFLFSNSNWNVTHMSDAQTCSDGPQRSDSLFEEVFPIAPSANRFHLLSNRIKKVTHMSDAQTCSDGPQRFDNLPQVLCKEGLAGCFYWEAEWTGTMASIAVAYKRIKRKGEFSTLGCDDKSWSLDCTEKYYSAKHKNTSTQIDRPSCSRRVGVYLDWLAGSLSFYRVDSDTLTHLHTFQSTFTEPLYPAFWLWFDSSVSLCQIT